MIEAINSSVSMSGLIWLSLVMFVIHDLEEIIWVEPSLKKNKHKILNRVPNSRRKSIGNMLDITSSQFAVAVLFEFVFLTVITFSAAEHGQYFWFLAFMTIFFLHVFTHLGQALLFKIYAPGVVTAILIVLPYTGYMIYRMTSESLVSWSEVLISIPFGVLIIPIVLMGHKLGKKLVPSN
jgi:hypothetical protein